MHDVVHHSSSLHTTYRHDPIINHCQPRIMIARADENHLGDNSVQSMYNSIELCSSVCKLSVSRNNY
jgi:hypothetical protein